MSRRNSEHGEKSIFDLISADPKLVSAINDFNNYASELEGKDRKERILEGAREGDRNGIRNIDEGKTVGREFEDLYFISREEFKEILGSENYLSSTAALFNASIGILSEEEWQFDWQRWQRMLADFFLENSDGAGEKKKIIDVVVKEISFLSDIPTKHQNREWEETKFFQEAEMFSASCLESLVCFDFSSWAAVFAKTGRTHKHWSRKAREEILPWVKSFYRLENPASLLEDAYGEIFTYKNWRAKRFNSDFRQGFQELISL